MTIDHALLRTVIDITWGAAFEDESVPGTPMQDAIIEKALGHETDWINNRVNLSDDAFLSEADIFNYLNRKYVQRSDERQKSMGLQYTTAETHDLAREIMKFVRQRVESVGR